MKIDSKITEKVNNSVNACRRVLVETTIELLKKIGAETGEDIVFENTLIFHQQNENISTTIVVDRIMVCSYTTNPTYIVSLGNDCKFSRTPEMLSVSNLQIIYDEVRKLVRHH